jgi:uncharacterized protein involved in type VI secretion and phage assembly
MTMVTMFEWGTDEEAGGRRPGASIALGTVTNNLDSLTEGKVLVRVTAMDQEVWARLAAPGAGSGAGFFYVPRIDDEVLVAFAGDDPTDGFIVGGLWNDRDRIPVSDPVSALAKRIIRSGVTTGTGHEIELDDTEQSVTITTSTKQKITLDPGKIELTNLAGTVKITLDNAGQSVSITAAASLKLEAPQITLKGATVEVNGTAMTTVKSGAAVNVTAPMVKIN